MDITKVNDIEVPDINIMEAKIDIHSHIIYDIDDGCKNIEESIETIISLNKIGFDKLVLTPHYIKGSDYCENNKKKLKKLNEIKKEVKRNNIEVELYLGNEIYINYEIEKLIKDGEIYPINNTKYLLIELPLYNEINHISDYLYKLKIEGYIPVIAHPERYRYFQKENKKMDELYDYGSLVGLYGSKAKKLLKYALKKDMVSFMSMDIHGPKSSLINNFDKIDKKLKKLVSEDIYKDITYNNALKIIKDKEV